VASRLFHLEQAEKILLDPNADERELLRALVHAVIATTWPLIPSYGDQ
jgi:hypothetical protein